MARRPLVPGAKSSLDKLKTEYANEIGVKLDNDYKGNRASKLNGAVGGPIGGMMVKKMIEDFERKLVDK